MLAKLVSGVSDKLCASCYGGGVTKMDKLPQLNEVYLCPVCSGTEYLTPGQTTEYEWMSSEEENYIDQ